MLAVTAHLSDTSTPFYCMALGSSKMCGIDILFITEVIQLNVVYIKLNGMSYQVSFPFTHRRGQNIRNTLNAVKCNTDNNYEFSAETFYLINSTESEHKCVLYGGTAVLECIRLYRWTKYSGHCDQK